MKNKTWQSLWVDLVNINAYKINQRSVQQCLESSTVSLTYQGKEFGPWQGFNHRKIIIAFPFIRSCQYQCVDILYSFQELGLVLLLNNSGYGKALILSGSLLVDWVKDCQYHCMQNFQGNILDLIKIMAVF